MGLIGILCRLWRGSARGSGKPGASERQPASDVEAEATHEASPAAAERPLPSDVTERDDAEPGEPEPEDDLTVISGIGAATQLRLHAVGIRSYGQLARATPQEVGRALVGSRRGARVEEWIRRAGELAGNR